MKKYLFVTTHFAPDFHYGGVVESGSKLYKYLKLIYPNFSLATVSKSPSIMQANEKCYQSIWLHRFGLSLDLILGLWNQVKNSDLIFINGTVTFPTVLAQIYAVLLRKKFIVSIRGTFGQQSVQQKKWKKYFYYNFIVTPLLRKANKIHVTSKNEDILVQSRGLGNTFLVSNGIDLVQYGKLPNKFDFIDPSLDDKFAFLCLSRMDKEKGIDILIEAFEDFTKRNIQNNYVLLLVGPDNQDYLKSLNLNNQQIKYISGIYGDEKIKVLRRANVVLLPSYNENFGNTIAEGFACERPVITTTGTPWNEIEKVGCGLYINPSANELNDAMQKIYDMSENERVVMGEKGRKYIFENFDWAVKAREIFEVMEKL